MNTLLTLTNGDKIGIYIACFLIIILFLIAVYYVLNGFRKESEWEKWQQEIDDYFKQKNHDN